jgi:hypothetical protein
MRKYATLREVVENPEYPFTIGMLRHLIAYRKQNGFHHVLRRPKKSNWLVNLEALDNWLEKSRGR